MDKYLELLGKSRIFPEIYTSSGFWFISFNDHGNRKRHLRDTMDFKISATATRAKESAEQFDGAMNIIIKTVGWLTALVYLLVHHVFKIYQGVFRPYMDSAKVIVQSQHIALTEEVTHLCKPHLLSRKC